MKNITILFKISFLLLLCNIGIAQTYTINTGGSVSTCSGNFYDDGGAAGNYTKGVTQTMTFCSSNGKCLSINFTSMDILSTDLLQAFDGPSIGSPLITKITNGNFTNKSPILSSQGCITIQFISAAAGAVHAGWAATIACVTCPAPTIVVTPSPTVLDIQNLLFGPDVTVSNLVINCPTAAYGTFTSTGSNLGLSSGLLLTTGGAVVAQGPNNDKAAGKDNTSGGDQCLNNYINGGPPCTPLACPCQQGCVNNVCQNCGGVTSYDACAIEFDIIPTCDSLKINYVFGSEEYPEYVGGTYNDAFAFFVSGPGITGTVCNNSTNIALVPGGSTPVSINNVNPTTNPQYYVDNQNGGVGTQYDGVTKVLTAKAKVIPCSSYHVKLVIADMGDGIYDSGVFLQKGGINCGAPSLTVTHTDAIECCKNGSFTFTLAQASATPLTINYTLSGTATSGSDYTALPGSITIPAGQTVVTFPVSSICDGLTEGSETIILSVGQAVCAGVITAGATLTITDPPTANAGTDKIICVATTGGANLTATGGGTYSWNPGTGLSCTTCANPVATPTVTTTYTVTVADAGGCTATDAVVITVACGIAVNTTSATVCNGICGIISATAINGAAPYVYTWSPATGLSATVGASVSACPTTTTTYTVIAKDANGTGISASATSVVTVNPNPTVTVPPVTICSTNSATLTASGATTYTWAPATGLNNTAGTSVTASPAATTTYTVTGSDPSGCTGVTTVIVTVNPKPTVTVPAATICSGQSTTLTATGSTSYTWSPSAGLSNTSISNPVASPTVTTTYTVIGNHPSGCTASATVVVTVNPPCGPVISATGVTVCNGICGTLTSTTSSGTPPYNYFWNTGATTASLTPSPCPTVTTTYTISVSDNSSPIGTATATAVITVNPNPVVTVPPVTICNGSSAPLTASGATTYTWSPTTGLDNPGIPNPIASPTVTTTYTVTGSFATGCTGTTTVIVTVNPIPIVSVPNASICPGGSTVLNATGATTYTWSPGTGLNRTFGSTVTANPVSTTTYTVVGTSGGCTSSITVTVAVGALIANAGQDVSICSGASIKLNASGGTIFSWVPITGLSNSNISNPVATPTVTTTYTVTVSDATCSDDDEVVVTVDPVISLNVAALDVTCFGACNGQLVVIPSGGNGAFTYSWSSGCTLIACNNICAGTYSLTATDGVGCTATGSTTVNQPTALTSVILGSTNVSCNGLCDGNAAVSVNGGSPPYNYSWTNGGITNIASGLCAGSYTVTSTDAKGCTTIATVIITQPAPVVISSTNAGICPNACAAITVSGSGGSGTIAFSWSMGASTNVVSVCPLATTTYSVTATDASGCIKGTISVVTVNPIPVINVPAAAICQGTTTILTANGANTYTWTPLTGLSGATGSSVTASPSATTTYTVTGTNSFGCTNTTTVIVTVNTAPTITPSSGNICPGESVPLTASGAITYAWSPSSGLSATTGSTVTANPATTTTYVVTGTGSNGCTSSATVIVTVHPKPVAAFTFSPQPTDIFDPTIYFNDQSTGGIINSWKWDFGDSLNTLASIQNPSFTYPGVPKHYTVHLLVTNQFGCIDTITGNIYIRGIFTFYIPNTFTPNNDGNNDGFMAKGTGIDENHYDLWIFDRWGNLIWHTSVWGEAWDGKANKGADAAQIDTYVWKVHVEEKETALKHDYIGHVNIVR